MSVAMFKRRSNSHIITYVLSFSTIDKQVLHIIIPKSLIGEGSGPSRAAGPHDHIYAEIPPVNDRSVHPRGMFRYMYPGNFSR